jgi:hypothetical protein
VVGVAQLVERWIVVPVAVGSNPTTHPNEVSYFVQVFEPQWADTRLPLVMFDLRRCTRLEGRILVHGEDEATGRYSKSRNSASPRESHLIGIIPKKRSSRSRKLVSPVLRTAGVSGWPIKTAPFATPRSSLKKYGCGTASHIVRAIAESPLLKRWKSDPKFLERRFGPVLSYWDAVRAS